MITSFFMRISKGGIFGVGGAGAAQGDVSLSRLSVVKFFSPGRFGRGDLRDALVESSRLMSY